MMRALCLELRKCRHKHIALTALMMVAVQGLWLMWSVRNMKPEQLACGYVGCLYQYPLINAIVMPVLVSVLVSRLCDMEHRGSALKQLLVMQPAGQLFDAKLLLTALCLLAITAMQLGTIALVGRQMGFGDTLLPLDGWVFLGGQYAVSLFLALFTQVLCLRYTNQFIPLAAGLIAGFLGLMGMFFSPAVMRLSPGSYYGLLSNLGMNWDATTRVVTYYHVPFSWGDLALLFAA